MCCCYRPPNNVEFWNSYQAVLDDVKSDNVQNLLILGDLNADFKTTNGRKLLQMCTLHDLACMVNEPTRITDTTATILDQIITNCPDFVKKVYVSPPLSTSDHCTVSAILNFRIKRDPAYKRLVWQYNKANFNEFRAALLATNFNDCFISNNVNEACERWTETFLNVARTHIPNRVVTIRPKDSPWYNNRLRLLKRRMQRCFKKYKKSRSEVHWLNYKNERKEYQRQLGEAEAEYKDSISKTLATSKNNKVWWSTMKTMLGKGRDTSYPSLSVNNKTIIDSEGKATEFFSISLKY